MIARALRSGARATGGLALVVLAACNSATPVLHGAPVLTGVYWVSGDAKSLVWTPASNPQAALLPSAPPFVSEIDFVFDRRLDGALIEETFSDGGVAMTRPMSDPPVRVTWPELPTPPAAFSYNVQYNSVGVFGADTSYVFLRPSVAGLPSGETVTFELVLEGLRSSTGEALASPSSVSVLTSALTVSVSAPSAAVAGTYQLPLAFSNRMSLDASAHKLIHVGAGGSDVPYALVADANLASRWYLAPADCLGRWPANTTFTVVVDPGLADAFGGKLSLGAMATFKTRAGADATPDCGAATVGDAAIGDAGDAAVGDAGDVAAADAGVESAGPEAGDAAAEVGAAAGDAGTAVDAGVDADAALD